MICSQYSECKDIGLIETKVRIRIERIECKTQHKNFGLCPYLPLINLGVCVQLQQWTLSECEWNITSWQRDEG